MLRVGLTGGIACGKSTVAGIFRELGYPVLDADLIAHQLLEREEGGALDGGRDGVYEQVVQAFEDVLDADGSISRPKLAAIVFADQVEIAKLNAILHPVIRQKIDGWFAALAGPEGPRFAVAEAALLVEAGYKNHLDRLIVVNCGRTAQVERLGGRGINEKDALLRIEAQMKAEERLRAADEVIDTSWTLEETRRQVQLLAQKLSQIAVTQIDP